MTRLFKKRRIVFLTVFFWFLLLYILAALVWWYIALIQQNDAMARSRMETLDRNESQYAEKLNALEKERKIKITQYNGEGITFLLLILVGAVFVYRAARRQIRLSEQQKNFMMAVTHELKTPIAVTRLNLETLRKRILEPPMQEKLIQNTLQEVTRLNDLVNNILLASELESGGYEISMEHFSLGDLLRQVVSEFQQRFPDRIIESRLDPAIHIYGDELLIRLAVSNLVENALKYSDPDKKVELVLDHSHGIAELKVKDQGNGIPENEKKKVFEKFYRVGEEITRRKTGTGLGLYLAKKICEDHRAELNLTDNLPTGSIFTIRFNPSSS